MLQEILRLILGTLDRAPSNASLPYTEVMTWPEAIRRLLINSKGIALMINGDHDTFVDCPIGAKGYCDGQECREPVQTDFRDDGTAFYYLECPLGKEVVLDISPALMERFVVDDGAWAHWLSLQLQTGATPELCFTEGPARLWRLGTASLGDYWLPCYLAIGTSSPGASALFHEAEAFRAGQLALVLVPDEIPSTVIGAQIQRRSLREFVSLSEFALDFNRKALLASLSSLPVTKQRQVKAFPTPAGATWDEVLITVSSMTAVVISVRGVSEARSYDELGFSNLKRGLTTKNQEDLGADYEWNECWEHFLRLAYNNGEVSFAEWANGATKNTVSSWASEINACISAVMRIEIDDALPYYRKDKVYRSSFRLIAKDSCREKIDEMGLLLKRYLGRKRPDDEETAATTRTAGGRR